MRNIKKSIAILSLTTLALYSCNKNDDANNAIIETPKTTISAEDYTTTVTEYQSTGSVLGTITGTTDQGEITYSITEQTPNNAISLDSLTGVVKVQVSDLFNYQLNQQITGKIKLTAHKTSETINFTIHISDLKNIVTTIAGDTIPGFVDGESKLARFNTPTSICTDNNGTIFITDALNHCIRKITPNGTVSTIAGNGTQGFSDGKGTEAQFFFPQGIAIDNNGNLYVSDVGNRRVRKITPDGNVTTLAGNGVAGFADGIGTEAKFKVLEGIDVDSAGNVFVADRQNHKIRKITPDGVVSTFAGSSKGLVDGTGTSAKFFKPFGLTIDHNDNLFIADNGNNKIRKITPQGIVSTPNIDNEKKEILYATDLIVDNNNNVYIVNGFKLQKLLPDGTLTVIAGNDTLGTKDGIGTEAKFKSARSLATLANGDILIIDATSHTIRKVDLD